MENNYKNEIVNNIDKINTTELGIIRIKKNLSIENKDVIEFCKECIIDNISYVEKKGKNYYVYWNDCKITINSYSYTIITAHRIKK